MRVETDENKVRLFPSDWRYSAAIVGLCKYFDYHLLSYNINEDYLEYDKRYLLEKDFNVNYYKFVESFFKENMHHTVLEDILVTEEISEEQAKFALEKMKANTVMKKTFGEIKNVTENKEKILQLIELKRTDLIQETYRNGKTMYAKFLNTGKLLEKCGEICRIQGYYIDLGKKSKSISYQWNFQTFQGNDEVEFDFIPFAFTKTRESFFINSSNNLKNLCRVNHNLQEKVSFEVEKNQQEGKTKNISRKLIFQYEESGEFIDYDVEIIVKNQEKEYFETIYLRQAAINIFKKISRHEHTYDAITMPCKCRNEYLAIELIVTDSIINGICLDGLIEKIMNDDGNRSFLLFHLILINSWIYGGEGMDDKLKKARDTAYIVKKRIEPNKTKSYRQKLISAITFKDYDRFSQILLQLSDYSGVIFNFAYDLFDDFEENKNVAYAFINALNESKNKGDN